MVLQSAADHVQSGRVYPFPVPGESSDMTKSGRTILCVGLTVGVLTGVPGCKGDLEHEAGSSCASGQERCDGLCVDILQSATNCGSCGQVCAAGALCLTGVCACQSGMVDCQGACVDLQGDGSNCGQCGTGCSSDEVCSSGHCSQDCMTAGQTQCGTSCVTLDSDPHNCGACGTACDPGQECVGGACVCPVGQTFCDHCVDLNTDGSNCGSCGTVCGGERSCQAGTCVGDGTGGVPGTGGGGPGDPCGTFTIDPVLAEAISTVGVVRWSTTASVETAHVDFGRERGNWEYSTAEEPAQQSGNRTLLLGMKAETNYSFQVVTRSGETTCNSPVQQITTGLQRTGLPSVTVDTQRQDEVEPGFTIACVFRTDGAMGNGRPSWTFILDHEGDYVWWYQGSGYGDCVRSRMSFDGQFMWIANGNVPGPKNGTLVRVGMDGADEQTFAVPHRHHDIAVLPDEKIAYFEYEGGVADACDVVKELDPATGESQTIHVVNQANPSFGTSCHSNAINWWPDQSLYTLSLLDQNAIIAFDRSGSLLWNFGGDHSDYSGASWRAQHNHDLIGDHLVFFNNQAPSGEAAVLEYQLLDGTAQLVWEYLGGHSSQSMGDVKRLPRTGNTLVTYSNQGVIQEVNSAKELVQQINTDGIGYTVHRSTLYGAPPPYTD